MFIFLIYINLFVMLLTFRLLLCMCVFHLASGLVLAHVAISCRLCIIAQICHYKKNNKKNKKTKTMLHFKVIYRIILAARLQGLVNFSMLYIALHHLYTCTLFTSREIFLSATTTTGTRALGNGL